MKKVIPIFISIILISTILIAPLAYGANYGPDLESEINNLNSQINTSKKKMEDIQSKQKQYQQAILQKQQEKATLNNQISILDNNLTKIQLDVDQIETQIDVTTLEIKKINAEIDQKNKEIASNKEHLGNVLKLMAQTDNTSALEVLLLNNNFSDFLNQVKYLQDINGELAKGIDALKINKQQLEDNFAALNQKNHDLALAKDELTGKVDDLNNAKQTKIVILDQTKSSEKEYQKLLKQAKAEQQRAAADIANMESQVREKMSQAQRDRLNSNENGLIWPVPKNRITAYFHDKGYPFRYIFEHPAIDIKAAQGTPIRAAASGYVARAHDAGMGYSYIMLVHGNNISTVYGHVSRIYVKQDEYVTQGQVIGLSGATPGTPGAGPLTTGAHLHFEVRLNGIPVDPLGYL